MRDTTNVTALLKSKPLLVLFICLLAILIVLALSVVLPPSIDWSGTYRPACLALVAGKSPYDIGLKYPYFSPPWGLFPYLPFALLPESIGRAALFLVSIVLVGFTIYRLGAKPLAFIAFLLSPPVIHCLMNSNLEWVSFLGFALPPQVGLFFISLKPQTGFAVALFWLVEAFRRGSIREAVRVFGPISITFLLSFLFFGFWPLHTLDAPSIAQDFNTSQWPASIPVGLVLITAAIRKREMRFAMGASPCLSPYVLFYSWTPALAALAPLTAEMIAAVIGLWIMFIIRAVGMSALP